MLHEGRELAGRGRRAGDVARVLRRDREHDPDPGGLRNGEPLGDDVLAADDVGLGRVPDDRGTVLRHAQVAQGLEEDGILRAVVADAYRETRPRGARDRENGAGGGEQS